MKRLLSDLAFKSRAQIKTHTDEFCITLILVGSPHKFYLSFVQFFFFVGGFLGVPIVASSYLTLLVLEPNTLISIPVESTTFYRKVWFTKKVGNEIKTVLLKNDDHLHFFTP